jgi:hypothetical protein
MEQSPSCEPKGSLPCSQQPPTRPYPIPYFRKTLRPLGRPRHRWEDNMKIDLGEIGLEGVD